MQWHLLPLVHHALSMGFQNLIVGDAKQSISLERGEVEQFVELPEKFLKEKSYLIKELEDLYSDHKEVKLIAIGVLLEISFNSTTTFLP